jgi:uncharacterized membrane protein
MNNNKLLNVWQQLRGSFWFLPSVMVGAAGLLAAGMLALDAAFSLEQFGPLQPLLYAGGTQATRGLLSTIGSSMLTVAGTTFSITMAVLTLTASNYGPRLLRIFMQDRGNQFVLGTFVATFLYCLIVLRSVQDTQDPRYVPHLSTSVAILLAVLCVGVLIYFIHHIAVSIQVATIVHNIGNELMETIGRVFPESIGRDATEHDDLQGERDMPPRFAQHSVPIAATNSGYVQTVDDEALLRLTSKHDLVIDIQRQPGHFVVEGEPLVHAWPAERVNDEVRTHANEAFALGKQRTMTQDVEFGILQLEEIAVRALSPSLNDPYTAVNSLDQLSVALCMLAERSFPGRYRYDEQHRLRVVATPVTFEHLLDIAFDQIRMNGNKFVMVLNKLLQVIAVVAQRVGDYHTLDALRQHAQIVEHSSHEKIQDEHDRQKVEQQYAATLRVIAEREAELQGEVQQLAAR